MKKECERNCMRENKKKIIIIQMLKHKNNKRDRKEKKHKRWKSLITNK